MSLVLADRVKETTTSTGTGTITLGGAVAGFQSFSVIGNGNTTYYTISGGTQWEVGTGTYNANTLTRNTVLDSSSGGALVIFASGSKDVFVTLPAERAITSIASANSSVTVTQVGSEVNLATTTGTVTSVAATAGTGISITGSPITTSGTLNITNTAPDQTVALTQGGTTTITGTYPNFTISSADQFQGTVTSVAATVPSLLSISGTPITASGTLAFTYSGTALPVVNGGTGQTTYTNGQLLIGNTTSNTLAKATLTAGAGVTITNSTGSITVASPLAQSTSAFITGAAQTYTAPANTQWVKVTVVGPGGNGGGAANQRATGGGGGGMAIKWLSMTAGQTLVYTVGTASGTASTVASGTLTITTITANSGTNGAGTAYALSQTAGGAGGAATNGDVNITGGQGGYSFGSSTTVSTNFSGKGGDCPNFGSGGPALAMVATAGVQGQGFGAGGGGAHGNATTAAGRGGVIIFEAY